MTDLIHECFAEFADSMKQFVTDSSAQRPTKRALVALKLLGQLGVLARSDDELYIEHFVPGDKA